MFESRRRTHQKIGSKRIKMKCLNGRTKEGMLDGRTGGKSLLLLLEGVLMVEMERECLNCRESNVNNNNN